MRVFPQISFFKEHDDVNEVLLEQAVTMAILSREDLSNDIPNPAEVSILSKVATQEIKLFVMCC